MKQTIRYAKARLVRFEAVKAYTYSSWFSGVRKIGYPVIRAGVTSLRRR